MGYLYLSGQTSKTRRTHQLVLTTSGRWTVTWHEMNMHQRKNQETEIVQTMGALSAGEKRQRPAREHVGTWGVQEVVDFVFGSPCSGRSLANAGPCEPRLYPRRNFWTDAAKVIELAHVKRHSSSKPFQRRRLKTLSAMPFTKDSWLRLQPTNMPT